MAISYTCILFLGLNVIVFHLACFFWRVEALLELLHWAVLHPDVFKDTEGILILGWVGKDRQCLRVQVAAKIVDLSVFHLKIFL